MNKDELLQKIEKTADEYVRPNLLMHGGNMQITDFKDGIVSIKLIGQCSGCPSAKYTLEETIKAELTGRIAEVEDVQLKEEVSQELIDFARELMKKSDIKDKK